MVQAANDLSAVTEVEQLATANQRPSAGSPILSTMLPIGRVSRFSNGGYEETGRLGAEAASGERPFAGGLD